MKRLKLFIPLFVFAILAMLFWYGLGRDPSDLDSALVGRTIPAFDMATVSEPRETVDQEALKGHPYALINVWATWCGPCRVEHPFLVELKERGIPIYGVNAKDELELAQEWLSDRGDPYRFSVFDPDGELSIDLGVYGYPETFLIDAEGRVLLRKTSVLSQEVWDREFQPIIDDLNE